MFMRDPYRRSLGQSFSELAVLLAVVAAALVAMQVYMKRGIQGRLRDLGRQISEEQYDKGQTNSFYFTTRGSTLVDKQTRSSYTRYLGDSPQGEDAGGSTPEVTTRTGWERVQDKDQNEPGN